MLAPGLVPVSGLKAPQMTNSRRNGVGLPAGFSARESQAFSMQGGGESPMEGVERNASDAAAAAAGDFWNGRSERIAQGQMASGFAFQQHGSLATGEGQHSPSSDMHQTLLLPGQQELQFQGLQPAEQTQLAAFPHRLSPPPGVPRGSPGVPQGSPGVPQGSPGLQQHRGNGSPSSGNRSGGGSSVNSAAGSGSTALWVAIGAGGLWIGTVAATAR
ncbi:hypothetical protein CLOM_g17149 [Closterium sp. NIES-68]|nr:hypothetical protein CLOM_g17149 [Closterium sp. NIES-68]